MSKNKRLDWENYIYSNDGQEKILRGKCDQCETVIISCALLDNILLTLLEAKLVNCDRKILFNALGIDGNINAPLSNFSSKIKMCYLLGIISSKEYIVIDNLRKVRNQFAHTVGINLCSKEMTSFIKVILENFTSGEIINDSNRHEWIEYHLIKSPFLINSLITDIVIEYTEEFKKRLPMIQRLKPFN